jgi:hypothetical protein
VFLPAILGTSHCLVFVPLINTVLLLGAPVLPMRWVKISTYLHSQPFLSIIFILINLKFLILFVHSPNVLCYVAVDAAHKFYELNLVIAAILRICANSKLTFEE